MVEAVLFDMDGVMTETATVHASAWKRTFDAFLESRAKERDEPFRPFDADRDYREFVDGRPRHDGVKRFLESRGVSLPQGTDADPPDAATVCGLGNRKNRYFHDWLDDHAVRTFPGAATLTRDLRQAGVKTALFSASRNAAAVLRSAGLLDVFDAIVTGQEADELKIPGKPDPAMLLEAVARLGSSPAHAAVVEDATAGIEAAVRGGFALVIGVDRADNGEALRRAGAHLVVRHLNELAWVPNQGLVVKTVGTRPSPPIERAP
jgi:beta-phosphoglucomutase family hydrolase